MHRLLATVDEAGRSPVADIAAAAWGYAPGTARHWRSSASHVFALPGAYLRIVPNRPHRELVAVAELMRTLGERGVAVVALVGDPDVLSGLRGKLHEFLGRQRAMVVAAL